MKEPEEEVKQFDEPTPRTRPQKTPGKRGRRRGGLSASSRKTASAKANVEAEDENEEEPVPGKRSTRSTSGRGKKSVPKATPRSTRSSRRSRK